MDSHSLSSQSQKQKAEALQALVSGPLASSASKLSGYSRGIPSEKDFHFYNNFDEFRVPTMAIAEKSESSLRRIGSSSLLWGKKKLPAFPDDLDEAYDWLVNLNDEFLERFGVCIDEFKSSRVKDENGGRIGSMEESGFQLVCGKKKKGGTLYSEMDESLLASSSSTAAFGVRMASKDKKTTAARSRVPFHIPTITRPQDEFNILVNNANEPFTHVWLERSDDGIHFVHPLEKLSVLDFVDRNVGEGEPAKPLPIESTPFTLVERVKDLKELASKLQNVNEFAVDLEHNQYRSFQGLTCLMQISTRTEDFVVDTLKLRVHVGPHLREVFKDPSKRKVMHGADRDIFWLQRDFGIYVCNLFDTGQASRVMQLERNTLEHLLLHFCEVTANKEYQNADWRLRPLPDDMLKYAREDTHYLLYIYDLMRSRLLSTSSDENGGTLLIEVYKRSYEICMQLYEKELLTDTSYLHIYGLHEADFNSQQLAIVAGLCEWRDIIARTEDESTGYILPNKTLLEIARQMPLSSGKLLRLVRSKHPFVERHLSAIVGIIRSSIQNASAFENVCKQLKNGRPEAVPGQNLEAVSYNSESLPLIEDPVDSTIAKGDIFNSANNASTMHGTEHVKDDQFIPANTEHFSGQVPSVNRCLQGEKLQPMSLSEIGCSSIPSDRAGTTDKENTENGSAQFLKPAKAGNLASVQMLKKPASPFGALLGNTSSKPKFNPFPKPKFNPDKGFSNERDKAEIKVEMIKSSVTLPFHSFTGAEKPFEPSPVEDIKHPHRENMQECADQPAKASRMEEEPAEVTKLEELILLENEIENSQSSTESPVAYDGLKHKERFPRLPENGNNKGIQSESDMAEESMSLSDLSSSFQKCFQSINERRNSKQNQRSSQQVDNYFQLKPFDYAAARNQTKLGKAREQEGKPEGADGLKTFKDSRKTPKDSGPGRARGEEREREFQQPRRRQAFSQSGNRSATFRE